MLIDVDIPDELLGSDALVGAAICDGLFLAWLSTIHTVVQEIDQECETNPPEDELRARKTASVMNWLVSHPLSAVWNISTGFRDKGLPCSLLQAS